MQTFFTLEQLSNIPYSNKYNENLETSIKKFMKIFIEIYVHFVSLINFLKYK